MIGIFWQITGAILFLFLVALWYAGLIKLVFRLIRGDSVAAAVYAACPLSFAGRVSTVCDPGSITNSLPGRGERGHELRTTPFTCMSVLGFHQKSGWGRHHYGFALGTDADPLQVMAHATHRSAGSAIEICQMRGQYDVLRTVRIHPTQPHQILTWAANSSLLRGNNNRRVLRSCLEFVRMFEECHAEEPMPSL